MYSFSRFDFSCANLQDGFRTNTTDSGVAV